MDAETAGAIAQLTDRIDALETSLRVEIRTGFAAVRREMHVLNESVRDDIRILAEGFATLSIKIDSLLR